MTYALNSYNGNNLIISVSHVEHNSFVFHVIKPNYTLSYAGHNCHRLGANIAVRETWYKDAQLKSAKISPCTPSPL